MDGHVEAAVPGCQPASKDPPPGLFLTALVRMWTIEWKAKHPVQISRKDFLYKLPPFHSSALRQKYRGFSKGESPGRSPLLQDIFVRSFPKCTSR